MNSHFLATLSQYLLALGDSIFHYSLLRRSLYNILLLDILMGAMVRVPIVSDCVHVIIQIWIINKTSGAGAGCSTAFKTFDQTFVQVACQTANVCAKLAISKKCSISNH